MYSVVKIATVISIKFFEEPLSWTRVVENESNLCASLYIQDDTLYLRLASKGTVMIVR